MYKALLIIIALLVSTSLFAQHNVDNPSYSTITIPDSVVNTLKADPDYWYADYLPAKKISEGSENISDRPWVQAAFWFVIVALFLSILFFYVRSGNFFLLKRNARKIDGNSRAGTDIFINSDFEQKIRKAIGEQNFREAVRLSFLQTLWILHRAGIIHYSAELTNDHYRLQVRNKVDESEFDRLIRVFEFTWYGKFDLNELHFQKVHQRFQKFQSGIKK